MKNLTSLLILFLATFFGCSSSGTQSHLPIAADSESSPIVDLQSSPSPTPGSSIRSVDFDNSVFPAWPIYSKREKPFTLKDGEYVGRLQDGAVEPYPVSLVDSIYGDVTGDGAEDAILVFTESIRGTAIPYYVYVYGMARNKPKLLWSFDTGDRAEGGLRQILAENGKLVVELYGRNKYVGGDYYSDSQGACCPLHYTRSRYQWRNNRFERSGELEVFPSEGGAPYMPLLERLNRAK